MPAGRTTFAVFFILGMVAIAVAAGLETRRFRRGQGIIGAFQFRLRLLASLVWMMVLGVNLYAVTLLWPRDGHSPVARAEARHFLVAVGSGFSLLLGALFLLIIDLRLIAGARALHEARFKAGLANLAPERPAESQSP